MTPRAPRSGAPRNRVGFGIGGLLRRLVRAPLAKIRFIRPQDEDAELARIEGFARELLARRPRA